MSASQEKTEVSFDRCDGFPIPKCDHCSPYHFTENSIQVLDFHKRYTCTICEETVKKHIQDDKEFIDKYNEIQKQITKITIEYSNGEKQYLEDTDALKWKQIIDSILSEMIIIRGRKYDFPKWKDV